MSGANQSMLVSNITWMKSTYGITAASNVNQQQKPAQAEPAQTGPKVYKEHGEMYFFDDAKWEIPVKKCSEFFQRNGLYKGDEGKLLETSLQDHKTFGASTAENKLVALKAVIQHAPLNDKNNLVPFLDFIRLAVLEPKPADYIADNINNLLGDIIQKYLIDKDYQPDDVPRAVLVIVWQMMANFTKHESSQNVLLSNYDLILMAATSTLSSMMGSKMLVNRVTIALNNMIFCDFGLTAELSNFMELAKCLIEIVEKVGTDSGASGKNEQMMLAASLNILCKMTIDINGFKAKIKQLHPSLQGTLSSVKMLKNKDIANLGGDLLFFLQ